MRITGSSCTVAIPARRANPRAGSARCSTCAIFPARSTSQTERPRVAAVTVAGRSCNSRSDCGINHRLVAGRAKEIDSPAGPIGQARLPRAGNGPCGPIQNFSMLLEAIEMLKKTQLVTAIGAVAGASFATAAIAADQTGNPFQADDLEAGSLSQNLGMGDEDKEGSCGEGCCGEGEGDDAEGSCGEGSCGEGEGDDKEGSCGEGSCGEGSCGAA